MKRIVLKGKKPKEEQEENGEKIIWIYLKQKKIPLPIRYGRYSGATNRKNTYTMVLSREYLARLGTGLIVPFKKLFLTNEMAKIKGQIKRLAKVEGIQKANEQMFWGAISI